MDAAADPESPSRPWRRLRPKLGGWFRAFRDRLADCRAPTPEEVRSWFDRQVQAESRARTSFFLVPVGLMIGIAVVYGTGWRIGLVPVLIALVPALVLAWWLAGQGAKGASASLAAFTIAGVALAAAELRWTDTTILSGEATVRIEGRVLWRDRDDADRMRYLVGIEATEKPVLSRPPERASILVSSRHDPIPVGGRFEGLVRLRAPSGPAYPGAYDFAFAPWFDGKGANGFALGAPAPQTAPIGPLSIGERLVRLRLEVSDRVRTVIGGGAGAVAAALMTGERSGIPNDVDEWLRATGLSHALSISGLHMALVAGFAMMLVRGALASIPGIALRLPTKKIAALTALAVATGYLVLSGSNVATDRSYIMLSIMLAAVLVDRSALTLRNVALAAIVVLVISPHAVVTASFQMSFAATIALVGIYGAIAKRRSKDDAGHALAGPIAVVALFFAGLAASSLIAGAATAPYAAYHFQRIAPWGVVANLVALPIFSFWIMPLALIAALLMPFGLDAIVLVLLGWGLDLVFLIAKVLATNLSDAPSGRLTPHGLVLVSVALMIGCLSASRLRWVSVPIALIGLWQLPATGAPPELLIFEDGRELAIIDADRQLHSLRKKPNDFVYDQWTRAFADPSSPAGTTPSAVRRTNGTPPASDRSRTTTQTAAASSDIAKADPPPKRRDAERSVAAPDRKPAPSAFACEPNPLPSLSGRGDARPPDIPSTETGTSSAPAKQPAAIPVERTAISRAAERTPGAQDPARRPAPPRSLCRATTRSGLRVAWTDDYRLIGRICDGADIAVMARAIRQTTCRSGARLVTLRTLRRTGSLAISRDDAGRIEIEASISDPEAPWNLHRTAPWPEAWRKPPEQVADTASTAIPPAPRTDATSNRFVGPALNTSGSNPPADPEP